jgi:hypothetical protein
MKNEECCATLCTGKVKEFATAILSVIIFICFYIKLLFFFTVFMEETNKAINSLQS